MIRVFLRLAAFFALGVLCLLLTSRWWLPPALPPLVGLWSVELSSVERIEGGRLRLSGLAVDLDAASIRVDELELPSEWTYLGERFFGDWSEATVIRFGRVQIVASERKTSSDQSETTSGYLPQIRQQVLEGLSIADHWVPLIELSHVEYLDENQVVASAESVSYQGRRFSLAGSYKELPGQWKLSAELLDEAPWQLEFSHSDWTLSGSFQLSGESRQVHLKGQLGHGESQVELAASFGDSGWLPVEAMAITDDFDLSDVQIPMKKKLSIAELYLRRFQAEWDGEHYHFRTSGRTLLQLADQPDQNASFDFSGEGDMEVLRLEAASLVGDWAQVELSQPLAFDFQRRSFVGEARLLAEADLAKQPWFEADGWVEAKLSAEAESPYSVRFELSGQNLAYANFAARSIKAEGRVGFDKLELVSLALIPTDADAGEGVQLSGTADFKSETLDMEFSALLKADWLNRMIGQTLLVAPLELKAGRATGAWQSPEIRGEVRTSLQTEAIEPIELSAALSWSGQKRLAWRGTARCNGAEIESEASVSLEPDAWSMRVESLRWSDPERPELVLESPMQLRWQKTGDSFEERLSFSRFVLRGDDLEASAAYSPSKGLELLLQNVSLARVDRWALADLPAYEVESFECALTDFRPFLAGNVRIAVEEQIDDAGHARLELSADLKERAIAVEEIALQISGEKVLKGRLVLPLRLRLPQAEASASKSPFYVWSGGDFRGRLVGHSSPEFTDWLQLRTGLQIGEATLDIELDGDPSRPVGHLHLKAEELAWRPELIDTPLPVIRAVDLQLKVDERLVDIQKLDFLLNQSAVQAAFAIPMDALVVAANAEVFEPLQLLRAASGKLRLEAWKMENWLDWLPPYFRRSGSLSGSFEIAPSLQLSGKLSFKDFGLRPTASLASVDQIEGQIRLQDRLVQIDEASALVGGNRAEFAGEMNLKDFENPEWFFNVSGKNLPLLRTTEMIVRSDLDIRVEARDPSLSPLVAGRLNLQSSTLLVDFDPLAPHLQKGAAARLPFFSIAEEPLANWRFDLRATGDRFMRVRSPYFKALLSADMKLTGNFAEPQLLGSLRTHDADLHFPGAKFVINKGEALIEASRPNEVQLAFNGIARKSSKVIVMEVSQTLEDPLIHFESTPSMSQANIVRMLATGSTTGGGVGNLGIYLGQGMLGAGGMNDSFADKLTVDVGEETSRSGRKTIDAGYELTPRWSVEGKYDVFDAYNADLIWTIFKR